MWENMSLADRLNQPKPQEPPAGWHPYKQVGDDSLTLVTKGYDAKEFSPETLGQADIDRILTEHNLTPGAWQITSWSSTEWAQKKGFKLIAKPTGTKMGVVMPSLDAIVSSMEKSTVRPKPATDGKISVVALFADLQVGKVDINGGTEELLIRLDDSLLRWEAYLQEVQPDEIIMADMGDGIEGFENTAQQAQTNDLGLIDQIDLFGFLRWKWLEMAAKYAASVIDVAVPSNHGAVRRNKDVLNAPDNDYGLLVQRFIKRQAGMSEKFAHLEFHAPAKWEESLTIHAIGGHRPGFVHGHQVSQPHMLDDWLYKQIAGRGPLEFAETVNAGHFHHLEIREGRGARKIIIAPSSDSGSAWIRNSQGLNSKAGVLTYTLDPNGPYDFVVC